MPRERDKVLKNGLSLTETSHIVELDGFTIGFVAIAILSKVANSVTRLEKNSRGKGFSYNWRVSN